MLGRKVVGGQQCVAILDQAFDRPAVLGAIFLGEYVDCHFGGRSVRQFSATRVKVRQEKSAAIVAALFDL